MRKIGWLVMGLVVLCLGLAGSVTAQTVDSQLDYVGGAVCAGCHRQAATQWSGSHHDLAMQEASEDTVLGAFDNDTVRYFDVESRFFRRDGAFMVSTEGPDGLIHDYPVRYTFGVYPLQQYLIEFPGGRLQALGIAWDSRPADAGGQRWFHLYPEQRLQPGDPLHWTGADQTWNYMCAFCHSTDLQKRYDSATDSYGTTWAEIDVSCEACHGPGSRHQAWAERTQGWQAWEADKGLSVSLLERQGVHWSTDPETGKPVRSPPATGRDEIEVCAPCHARRSTISEDVRPGHPFLDGFRPNLLSDGLYFADGQIEDEVYVYGSFLQSRMYQAGVTCSDCHDPHSLALRTPGNAVCTRCHQADRYDSSAHHKHPEETAVACVDCHMPERIYMGVDLRRDHSFRVPRPDISARLGTPEPCTTCHQRRNARWAADQLIRWYGETPRGYQDFADTLAVARQGSVSAGPRLAALATAPAESAIVRATALSELGGFLNRETLAVVAQNIVDPEPLVRLAALGTLDRAPLQLRAQLAFVLLDDPLLAVRIEAARVLAGIPRGGLDGEQSALLDRAENEYVASQLANAERPESYLNLGGFYARKGDTAAAEVALQRAIKLQPRFVPAYVNLADLYRTQGRDAEGEQVLQEIVARVPTAAGAHHALGLLRVRRNNMDGALESLAMAARMLPDYVRYGYVYAVALNSAGRNNEALGVLEQLVGRYPDNPEVLGALVGYLKQSGDLLRAADYAERLQAVQRASGAAPAR